MPIIREEYLNKYSVGAGKNTITVTASDKTKEGISVYGLEESDVSDSQTYDKLGSLAYTFNADLGGYVVVGIGDEGSGNIRVLSNYDDGQNDLKAVVAIAPSAFENNNQIETVEIPGTVTQIGSSAFYGCRNLKKVTLGYGVATIGSSAFYNSSIKSITIPQTVTEIGSSAFADSDLEEVTFENLEDVTVFFDNVHNWKDVYCFYDGYDNGFPGSKMYKNDDGMYYCVIPRDASNVSFNNGLLNWSRPENLSTINHTDCWDAYGNVIDYRPSIIPHALTIGAEAFAYCTSLTAAQLPDRTTSIGELAFISTNLRIVQIPDLVTKIPYECFSGCKKLTDAIIGERVVDIEWEAFLNCTILKNVTLGGKVATIEESAFANTIIESIDIPESVTKIYKNAFHGCSKLAQVYFEGLNQRGAWMYTTKQLNSPSGGLGNMARAMKSSEAAANILNGSATNSADTYKSYSTYNWYKIYKMPKPTLNLSGATLTMADDSNLAESFNVYIKGVDDTKPRLLVTVWVNET